MHTLPFTPPNIPRIHTEAHYSQNVLVPALHARSLVHVAPPHGRTKRVEDGDPLDDLPEGCRPYIPSVDETVVLQVDEELRGARVGLPPREADRAAAVGQITPSYVAECEEVFRLQMCSNMIVSQWGRVSGEEWLQL